MTRRELLVASGAAALPASAATSFQIACMTLPYSQFPLARALEGIQRTGYKFVAWGTTHQESAGQRRPVMAVEAPPSEAKALAARCRGPGLEPVMMFATVQLEQPDALAAHLRRIEQAAAARIPYLLTFGKTTPGEYQTFIGNLKRVAPAARQSGVTVLIKQHGGNTGTGQACARIVEEVGDEGLRICYDGGNVMDYERADPIPDIQACARHVRAFAIKDHRYTPRNQDCGPGLGELDHYKLLLPVARTGLNMPLACENIFEPIVARPANPEGVDALARRAREFLETVIRGVQST
ncbi:MAG: TIM barrel protein [Acidobacteria bacterium]|nr:TIM barrel protein [Acidobacteriota bacterium]